MFDMELLKILKHYSQPTCTPDIDDMHELFSDAYDELIKCYRTIIDLVEDI